MRYLPVVAPYRAAAAPSRVHPARKLGYLLAKRLFDITGSLLLLPILCLLALGLLLLNPLCNAGPLCFTQPRMGRRCRPFVAIKFRTMHHGKGQSRSASAPLELDRITPLGRFLRQSRLDEIPQILNVLRGEMSLIGPRPDCLDHAVHFIDIIPGYRERHAVLPGISGYAQTKFGYAVGIEATRRKVSADLFYIENRTARMEVFIIWRTLLVVLQRSGR